MANTKLVVDAITGETKVVEMSAAEIAEIQEQANNAAIMEASWVPKEVAMWQVRTVLQQNGLLKKAETAIASANNAALTNIWQYGNFAKRSSPSIATLGEALNLTPEQIDDLFREAYNLEI